MATATKSATKKFRLSKPKATPEIILTVEADGTTNLDEIVEKVNGAKAAGLDRIWKALTGNKLKKNLSSTVVKQAIVSKVTDLVAKKVPSANGGDDAAKEARKSFKKKEPVVEPEPTPEPPEESMTKPETKPEPEPEPETKTETQPPESNPNPSPPTTRPGRDPRLPAVGQNIPRVYKGETYNVCEQVGGGFALRTPDGEVMTYPSLSAAARSITGSNTNGFSFFKLGSEGAPRRRGSRRGPKVTAWSLFLAALDRHCGIAADDALDEMDAEELYGLAAAIEVETVNSFRDGIEDKIKGLRDAERAAAEEARKAAAEKAEEARKAKQEEARKAEKAKILAVLQGMSKEEREAFVAGLAT